MKRTLCIALTAMALLTWTACGVEGAASPPTTVRAETPSSPKTTTPAAVTAPPSEPATAPPLTLDERFNESPYDDSEVYMAPRDAPVRDGLFVLSPYRIGEFVSEGVWSDWNPDYDLPYDPEGVLYGYEEDFSDGCGWGCLTSVYTLAEATSTLPDEGDISYTAENVYRGDRTTAWVEGAEGYGVGESITVRQAYMPSGFGDHLRQLYGDDYDIFHDTEREIPAVYLEDSFQVTGMYIVNGYAKSQALWAHNSRVKTLKLYINDEPYAYIELTDTIKPQFFSLYGISLHCGPTYSFRFEILEIYPGAVADTCITGMGFTVTGLSGAH